MRLPLFTAESSLGRSGRTYHGTSVSGRLSWQEGVLEPQLTQLEDVDALYGGDEDLLDAGDESALVEEAEVEEMQPEDSPVGDLF